MSKNLNKQLEVVIAKDREFYTKDNKNLCIYEYVNSILKDKDFLEAKSKEVKVLTKFKQQITDLFFLFGAFLNLLTFLGAAAAGIISEHVSCGAVVFGSFLFSTLFWLLISVILNLLFEEDGFLNKSEIYLAAFFIALIPFLFIVMFGTVLNLQGVFLFTFLLWFIAVIVVTFRITVIRKKLIKKAKSAKKAEVIKNTYDKLARLHRMIPYMQNVELINSTEAIESFVTENYKKFE